MSLVRFLLLCALFGTLVQVPDDGLAQDKVQLRKSSEGALVLTNMPKPELARLGRFRMEHKEEYRKMAVEAAQRHGLEFKLLDAVIEAESQYQPRAVSSKGARGLMQIMPQTGWELGLQDAFDPAQNIEAGARYLRAMLDRFGSTELALAAYNAGPKAVEKHNGIPPFRETQLYVKKIMAKSGAATGETTLKSREMAVKSRKVKAKKNNEGGIILQN